jgi:hypothetical protein
MEVIDYVKILALLVEAIGIFLLFREVRWAHDFEMIDFGRTKQREAKIQETEKKLQDNRFNDRILICNWLLEPTARRQAEPEIAHRFVKYALDLDRDQAVPRYQTDFDFVWDDATRPQVGIIRKRMLYMGVTLLISAILIEAVLYAIERTHKPHVPVALPPTVQNLFRVEPIIVFDPSEASLGYVVNGKKVDLQEQVCSVKKELLKHSSRTALVIGRHDQVPLGPAARARFSSNEGLAQKRAEAVKSYLSENNDCGLGIESVMSFNAGARNVGVADRDVKNLSLDRSVEVWGFSGEKRGREPFS